MLAVTFDDGHTGHYHKDWLYSWGSSDDDTSDEQLSDKRFQNPALRDLPYYQLWDAKLQTDLPQFDGTKVLRDEDYRFEWLRSIHTVGFAVASDCQPKSSTIEEFAQLMGPIRPTNFGRLFDVKTKPAADSNAYTAMALPAHTDLGTREYAPGLQLLFCVENSTTGAESILVDGFALARYLEQHHPQEHKVLKTVPIGGMTKSTETDYRFSSPPLVYDEHGQLTEVRVNPWLRSPLIGGDLATINSVYKSLRLLFKLAASPQFEVRFTLEPGMLLTFDNRRLLHGRTSFENSSGHRWLRGCYLERDDLYSALRISLRRLRERQKLQ